jgi:hypothetical protein
MFLLVIVSRLSAQSLALNVPQSGNEGATLVAAGTVLTDVNTNQFPITVYLFSFDTDRVRVPPFVLIPPGTNLALFDLELVENELVHNDPTVVIEAVLGDEASDLDVIRVIDNESRAMAVHLPPQVIEGQGTLTNAGRVSFFGIPAMDVTLTLQSSHPELISVPPSVIHSAGQTSTWFHLTMGNDFVTNVFTDVWITASAVGFLSATSIVRQLDDELLVPGTPVPADQAAQVPLMTILRWKTGAAVLPGTVYDVYFGDKPTLGESDFLGSTTMRAWMLPPLAPGSTYYWQVRTRVAEGVAGPVWQFSTRGVDHFEFAPVNSPQLAEECFTLEVTARDELNRVMTNFDDTVTFSVLGDGNGTSATILTHTGQVFGSTSPSRTVGYSFTPSSNITVTGVRHYFGNKVSIWTDTGVLLSSQPVFSTITIWNETPLATPLVLKAGTRYRVTATVSNSVSFNQTNLPSSFPAGTIHQSYSTVGDAFPDTPGTEKWWLVDLRYDITVPVTPQSTDDFVNGVWSDDFCVLGSAKNLVLMVEDATGRKGISSPIRVLPKDQPLTFLAQPKSQAVGQAAPVSMTSAADGMPPITYQWLRDGVPITDDAHRTGTAGAVLTISNAEDDDSGTYSVAVSNPFTTIISTNATLEVRWADHFAWAPVSSPQLTNTSFAVTVEAQDYLNRTMTNFNAWVSLSGTATGGGTPIPATYVPFENGVWSGFITVSNPSTNLVLRAEFDGATGSSQPINVVPSGQPLFILGHPFNRAIRSGSNAVLEVKVFGSAPISYQWRRTGTNLIDGGRLSGTTNSFLSISGFQASDVGTYSVVISNQLGTVTSSNASLTLDLMVRYNAIAPGSLQRLTNQLFPFNFEAVDAANQRVLTGPPPTIFTGTGDGGYTVTLDPSAGFFSAGLWSGAVTINQPVTNLVLRVDDGTGRFGLSPALQIVPSNQPTVVITWPTNLVVRVGETARFHANAYAAPNLVYSWNTNLVIIQNGGRFSGQGTTTLTISNTVESDSKTYSVIMANGLGPAINVSATLNVFRQHHFMWGPIPSPQSIFRPVPVRLEARDFSNILVTNFTRTVQLSASLASNGFPVIISPTVISNFTGGVWNGAVSVSEPLSDIVLRAEDAYGNTGSSAPFDTEQTVSVTQQPTNQFVLPGTNVTLVAAAEGSGLLRYQWQFEGTNLFGATNATFSFTNANLTNYHGNFTVTVMDYLGSTTSSNALIYVLIKPGIVTAPRPLTVLEGETAIFTCVATGAPPLAYRWISNSAPILTSAVPFLVISNAQPRVPPLNFRVIVQNVAGSTFAAASTNVALTVLADHDRDGLADVWEVLYGFNTNNTADALLDPDGDTLNNRAEYLSGTDPTNAASVLRLALNETNPGLLQFIAQSNVAYRVEYRTNLAFESWSAFTSLAAQAFSRTAQVSVPYPPSVPARYYRIVTLPAP